LLAFEPSPTLKESTLTWLRSRATLFSRQMQASGKGKEQAVMESMFARLLSLLAYHPDYPPSNQDTETRLAELADFSRYILFYLSAVANENNISLIYHVAQRVKQTRDGITRSDEITTRLHTLSDLAQVTNRLFAEVYAQQHKIGGAVGSGTILETYPGKMRLPSSLFSAMESHKEAQDVADKSFLPEEIEDVLDGIVRSWMRPKKHAANVGKKRKSEYADTNGNGESKKARKQRSSGPRRSTGTKKKRNAEDEWGSDFDGNEKGTTASRRRSGRGVGKGVSYADRDSDEDDLEMQQFDQDDEDEDEGDDENEEDGEDEEEENNDDENKEASDDNDEEMADAEPSPPVKTNKNTPAKKSSPVQQKSTKTENLPVRRSTRRG
jgi:sister-chromatid-cohesion protein PDS5